VNLDEGQCRQRLAAASHGVLASVHPTRGVDAVPVVYAPLGLAVVIPVDRVKSKRSTRLQRLENIASDDRCVLLVEHYEDDWSRLWWVRMHARAVVAPPDPDALGALRARYPAYAKEAAIDTTILLTPTAWYGWQA
jgi:PPOX class probable F420-dependent enzyme